MEIFFCLQSYQILKQTPEQVVKFPPLEILKALSNLI